MIKLITLDELAEVLGFNLKNSEPEVGEGYEFCDDENAEEYCISLYGGKWTEWSSGKIHPNLKQFNKICRFRRKKVTEPEPEVGEGYRFCSRNDAISYSFYQNDNKWSSWISHHDTHKMTGGRVDDPKLYRYRCPNKPEVGDGYEFCDFNYAEEVCVFDSMDDKWLPWNNDIEYYEKAAKRLPKHFYFRRKCVPSIKEPAVEEGYEFCSLEDATEACVLDQNNQWTHWFFIPSPWPASQYISKDRIQYRKKVNHNSKDFYNTLRTASDSMDSILNGRDSNCSCVSNQKHVKCKENKVEAKEYFFKSPVINGPQQTPIEKAIAEIESDIKNLTTKLNNLKELAKK